MRKWYIVSLLFCMMASKGQAQSDLKWQVDVQSTYAGGEYSPLWLNANKYGLSSLEKSNGYVQVGLEKPVVNDSTRKWEIGYGASVVGAYNFTSSFFVQEAYGEVRWLKGRLTVGSKEYPMELKNNELSSGSQAQGINARPVPQVRLALPDYWTFAKGWLGIKGHIAYGMTTDDEWQKDFSQQASRYTEHTLYHSKAGYLKIGKPQAPLSVELGLEMACVFGGNAYQCWQNGKLVDIENKHNLKSFWDALVCAGGDVGEGLYANAEGNQLGSWVGRINYDAPTWELSVYYDKFFEDHSQMFLVDYDGYGTGENWNKREKFRFLYHGLKDIMLGGELHLKKCKWIDHLVVEYLYTKHQSGPIRHERTENIQDHMAGKDNYYNHNIFTGWQHWGQVMGNPLYRSPLYNSNQNIQVEDNRFVAWHGGIGGHPLSGLSYRLLATYQTGLGTYDTPYPDPRYNLSLLAESSYQFPASHALKGWGFSVGVGMDKGKLLSDNYGVQVTIRRMGFIHNKKK